MNAYKMHNPASSVHDAVNFPELEYIAFTGQFEQVHAMFHRIPMEERKKFANKHILSQAIWGGIEKLRKLLAVHAESSAEVEKAFIDDTLNLFIEYCKSSQIYPRELFQSILYWSDELVRLSLADEALYYIEEALNMGISKYPDLQIMLLNRMAQVYNDKGDVQRALSILSDLAHRPFLITDRNQIPEILLKHGKLALRNGDVKSYKTMLLGGLRHFYTNIEDRRLFVDQLSKTYRRAYRLLLDREIRLADKFLFFAHWFYYKMPDFGRIKLRIINNAVKVGILGYVYALNYFRGSEQLQKKSTGRKFRRRFGSNGKNVDSFNVIQSSRETSESILITRAMGGIGDLLMMTPGIHALKRKYPGREIHLAIPKRYFSVFNGNGDVVLLDIEKDRFNFEAYHKWFNLTDCPAARVEARTAPRVKRSRIDIFAGALGIYGPRLWEMDRRPRYVLSEEDKEFREAFWQRHGLIGKEVIGIQLHADEIYRDYPHMEQLVRKLARHKTVLVFDAKPIKGYDFENVIKVDSYNIRQAFALVSRCNAIVAPDSAFVHLSAAFNIPCVALFGPIDGEVRTKHYPLCHYLDASATLNCVSCWRNESIPCKLTNMRVSVCMGHIPVSQILNRLNEKVSVNGKDKK